MSGFGWAPLHPPPLCPSLGAGPDQSCPRRCRSLLPTRWQCRSPAGAARQAAPSCLQRLADNPVCPPGLCGRSVHRSPGAGARGRARGAGKGCSGAAGGAEGAQSHLCAVTPVLSLLTEGIWGCSWGPLCSLAANGTGGLVIRKRAGGDRVYPAAVPLPVLRMSQGNAPLYLMQTTESSVMQPRAVWGSCRSSPGAPGGSWWVTSPVSAVLTAGLFPCWVLQGHFGDMVRVLEIP